MDRTPADRVTGLIDLGEPFGGSSGGFGAGPTDHGDLVDLVDQHGEIDCLELRLPLGAYGPSTCR